MRARPILQNDLAKSLLVQHLQANTVLALTLIITLIINLLKTEVNIENTKTLTGRPRKLQQNNCKINFLALKRVPYHTLKYGSS